MCRFLCRKFYIVGQNNFNICVVCNCVLNNHLFFFCHIGHGDNNSKNIPCVVREIGPVGQVACGSAHTVCVSQDGHTVWSFGSGDNGKFYNYGKIRSLVVVHTLSECHRMEKLCDPLAVETIVLL